MPNDDPRRPWEPPRLPTPQPVGLSQWAKLVFIVLKELWRARRDYSKGKGRKSKLPR